MHLSSDAASVGNMGEEEFGGGLDSGSFMAQLAADEAAVQEANRLMLVSTMYTPTVHVRRDSILPLRMHNFESQLRSVVR